MVKPFHSHRCIGLFLGRQIALVPIYFVLLIFRRNRFCKPTYLPIFSFILSYFLERLFQPLLLTTDTLSLIRLYQSS